MENSKLENKIKFKSYRKQLKSDLFEIDNELVIDDENEAQIECKIGKIENLFSPFDIAKNRTINDSFHTYLMQETEIIPQKHSLELCLHVNPEISPEQEEQIKKSIKRHYSFNITATNLRLKKASIVAAFLYLLGFGFIFINFFLGAYDFLSPFNDTLLIITWFLVWEASSVALFDRGTLKRRRYNMLRIYNAKITFIKDNIIL